MTRANHAHAQPASARDVVMQPRAALKKKKPYKIVLEAITQEKKKLHSIVCLHEDENKIHLLISISLLMLQMRPQDLVSFPLGTQRLQNGARSNAANATLMCTLSRLVACWHYVAEFH